jgi:protein-tyrosine phosphatase
MKILMVCLGNICRSPMAEGILRAKSTHLEIEVDSAGTSSYHYGENPDVRAVHTLRKKGINISNLIARQFTTADFDAFDIIFTMDKSNYDNVIALARSNQDKQKVRMLVNELHPGSNGEVPDPYFGGDQGFEDVYNLIDEATDKFLMRLQNEVQ